jgi:pimeloyl-ACP methyl ester carboxylesterase
MARRARMLDGRALQSEIAAVRAPALVVTGEPHLDLVVPVRSTHEYLRLWPQAEAMTLPRTGHLGVITRADEFAAVVAGFADRTGTTRQQRRQLG